jgi:GxxExxY protein
MNADGKRLDGISKRVIGCAFTVANALGVGFLEKVYENALTNELTKAGLMVSQQIAIGVEYNGVTVGAYGADLLRENAVLVEIKAVRALDPAVNPTPETRQLGTSRDFAPVTDVFARGKRRQFMQSGTTIFRTRDTVIRRWHPSPSFWPSAEVKPQTRVAGRHRRRA